MKAIKENNPGLRLDITGELFAGVYKNLQLLLGCTPQAWADGRTVTNESIVEGMQLFMTSGVPLLEKYRDQSVGVRREYAEAWLTTCVPAFGQGEPVATAPTDILIYICVQPDHKATLSFPISHKGECLCDKQQTSTGGPIAVR